MPMRLYLSPKGTNQVEGNPALHLLLRLCAFCFNYSNPTRNSNPQIFPLPKPSLLPPHEDAVSHTHEDTHENLRAVFETGAPQVKVARVSQKKKKVFTTHRQAIKIPFRQLFKPWKDLYLFPSHTQTRRQMKHKKVPISMLGRRKLGFASLLPGSTANTNQNMSTCCPTGRIIRRVLAFSSCRCRELL